MQDNGCYAIGITYRLEVVGRRMVMYSTLDKLAQAESGKIIFSFLDLWLGVHTVDVYVPCSLGIYTVCHKYSDRENA